MNSNKRIDGIILAGGPMDEALAGVSDAPNKAYIHIGDRPMVSYVIEAARQSRYLDRIVLVTEQEWLTPELSGMVDIIAPPGEKIVLSLGCGIQALSPLPDFVVAMPSDIVLLTTEALDDFIGRSLDSGGDLTYGYLSRADSEARFPDVNHTYVKIDKDSFCGTGFFMMNPGIADRFENLLDKFTANRKNVIGLAGLLGLRVIISYLLGTLMVKDVEKRVKKLLRGSVGKGIRTKYPEAGFNVDAPNELEIARRIITAEPGQGDHSR